MLFAQNKIEEMPILPEISRAINQKGLNSVHTNKALGDTLWYEDFGGGFVANGWTNVNPNQNGFDWIHTTAAPGGQYSTSVAPLQSTTAANGFASMPAGFYNTPTPFAGFINMSSTLNSSAINIAPKGSVILTWQQGQRYCCASFEQIEVQVSTDGINFVAFDAKFGRQANTTVNLETATIDISSVAAFQSTIYLRFYFSATHYYWMIDDIAIIEGANNSLSVNDYFLLDSQNQRMAFSNIPCSQTTSILPGGTISNLGGLLSTNVGIKSSVTFNNSTVLYSDSTPRVSSLLPRQDTTLVMQNPFVMQPIKGQYTALFKPVSDSVNQTPGAESISFNVTDTVFSRDNNNPDGSIGPASYVGGDNDGSKIGLTYDIYSPTTTSSISIFIDSNIVNVGAVIDVELSRLDTIAAALNQLILPPLAVSNLNYIISSSDLGKWITFPFTSPVNLLAGNKYVAIVEQKSGNNNGFELMLGRDRLAELNQPFGLDFVSVLYGNDASPSWANIFAIPMIRLNIASGGCITVGVEDQAKVSEQINVFPNPSKGFVNIQLPADHLFEQIEVYAINGKKVLSTTVTDQSNQLEINLADHKKGIYFLRLISKGGVFTNKVVID